MGPLTNRRATLYHDYTMLRRRPSLLVLVLLLWIEPSSFSAAGESTGAPDTRDARTLVVALDGTGAYRLIQEAVDAARPGDTVLIKAGEYAEDVTIHSKDRLRVTGEHVDRVKILGRNRVGSFHIGKWPYGATNVEISHITIEQHGGLALGMFNGKGVQLRNMRINGLVFGQQVQDVRLEACTIGGSETTGVQLADSQVVLTGNVIHDNDHGVTVAGKSDVRLERNVITGNLFEAVVVNDSAKAVLVSNTIAKNGGGVAFLQTSQGEASANVIGLNKVGFAISPSSRPALSYNALYNSEHNYVRAGAPPVPAPDLRSETDVAVEPRFVDAAGGDFRLRADSELVGVGTFAYLGALPPFGVVK
jgi:hypothetical protein